MDTIMTVQDLIDRLNEFDSKMELRIHACCEHAEDDNGVDLSVTTQYDGTFVEFRV